MVVMRMYKYSVYVKAVIHHQLFMIKRSLLRSASIAHVHCPSLSSRSTSALTERQRRVPSSPTSATMSTNGLAFTSSHHVQNDLWSRVDKYTLRHLHPRSRSNVDALRHALITSRDSGLPDIATSPTFAKYMALQCKARGVKHALELGTLGGYGSLWVSADMITPALHN